MRTIACRQGSTSASSLNLQSGSTEVLAFQRPSTPGCAAQAPFNGTLANTNSVLLRQRDDNWERLSSLGDLAGQMLHIMVPIGLPAPPEFVQVPRWDAAMSTSRRAAVSGSVNGPALLFYAVRGVLKLSSASGCLEGQAIFCRALNCQMIHLADMHARSCMHAFDRSIAWRTPS